MTGDALTDLSTVAQALSDPGRLRVLAVLNGRELCVCQITELLSLAPSTVSKHLAVLSAAGLIRTRKEGRWVHCRLPSSREAAPAVRQALAWLRQALCGDAQCCADEEQLCGVLAIPPEELTRRQAARQKSCCPSPKSSPKRKRQ